MFLVRVLEVHGYTYTPVRRGAGLLVSVVTAAAATYPGDSLPAVLVGREWAMTDNAKLVQSEAELERVLEDLQKVERFEPRPEFRLRR
jgi:hypothetical protein